MSSKKAIGCKPRNVMTLKLQSDRELSAHKVSANPSS